MLKKYFSLNPWFVLGVILISELALNILLKSTLLTEKVLYNSLVEQLALEDIETFSNTIRASAWMMVVFGVLQRFAEIVLISVCINIGTLLFNYNIRFRQIFGVVVLSFLIFTLSRLPLFYSLLAGNIETFEDLTFIPMLSLSDVYRPENLPQWALYPLQLVNVYQLAFFLLLAAGLNLIEPKGYLKWLGLIALTYGTGLLITVVLMIFATTI